MFVYNLSSPTTLTDNQFITYKTHQDSIDGHSHSPSGTPLPEPESDMRINFRLNLTPEATMKILMDPKAGDYIALNGHGNIRANYYNKGDFTMYGTYTIDHGIYKLSLQDVIRKGLYFQSRRYHRIRRSARPSRPQPASRLHRTLRIAERPERTLHLQPK